MKYVSIVAVLIAMSAPLAATAQDVSASASASASVSVSEPDMSSAVSSVSSELSSAVSSVSSELSSAVSSVSSELSSALSSALSSEPSSELSSSASMSSSSGMENNCDDLDIATMNLGPVDAMALAAVTIVTIFTVDDCTGLGDLAQLDGGALTAIGANQAVIDALATQGASGAEVLAYTLDGTSLTVYVRSRNP